MTRTQNNVSPEVAQRLAEVAREMRDAVYGEAGFPEWGTKFTEIEAQGMNIGLEIARLFMEQAVDQQAHGTAPPGCLESGGETAQVLGVEHEAQLETPAGEIGWDQPKDRLKKAQRDFFPSSQIAGREC
ncbi:MAG: hypothetical protein ACC645_27905 [Pirellulales bacterium]